MGHNRCGAALGHPTGQGRAGTLGKAVGDRSPVCPVFQRRGSPHRGSAAATASSLRASTALSLPGRRSHRTDCGGRVPALAKRAAGGDLRHLARPVGRHRDAHQRTGRVGSRRCGSEPRQSEHPGCEVRQIALASAASDHHRQVARYAERRDGLYPTPPTPSFFLSEQGTRLTTWSVRRTFVILSHQIGLRAPQDHHGPRPHDLRHRFAIRTLLHWYRCGDNVEQRLPELAAYLGHAHVSDTYWYLSATPELLALAAQRLEPDRVREVQR